MINKGKGAYRPQTGKPVEQRLMEKQRVYQENAEKLKNQILMEELQDIRDGPQINPKSEALIEGKEEMKSRVEDRLMVIGKMWKEKRERLA